MKTEYMLILQAAMDERQKRLRPEIRLLNELMMGSTTPEERREVSSSPVNKLGKSIAYEAMIFGAEYCAPTHGCFLIPPDL